MYDIIFISYDESNAEENWNLLKSRFGFLCKRIKGVPGIHQAHIAASNKALTNMFWVVDGDAQILDNFNFNYIVDEESKDIVYVWKSQNPINGLIYGYGGVKLLPRLLTKNMNIDSIDMTTSISSKFKLVDEVSNITAFNTDPFNSWKSAFRECVKLSSRIIPNQENDETEERLDIWCTVGKDKPYGEYAIRGAMAGKEFGLKYANDPNMLSKINDWDWLSLRFNQE